MKNWVKLLTMAIVGAVFLIGVAGAQEIKENGTETLFTASSGELAFDWDKDSQYDLSFPEPSVQDTPIIIPTDTLVGTLYEFVIPNFYDPLLEKTVEITINGANSGASGLELAMVLDVFGSDSLFGVSSPALPAYGVFSHATIEPTIVNEVWEMLPNPDFEIVKIWVPTEFELVSIKIVTQSFGQPPNLPPEAICQDVTVSTEPGLCTADASIDAGSSDPDGDPITLVQDPYGPYDLGDTDVTLTVTDDMGASDTCKATVTVVDQEAPVISSVTASPDRLWPPNHNMVPVVLAVDATDNCDLVCQIESVASNEPVNGLGDGDTAPDWEITDDLTVDLRAERSGTGSGRIYTITVVCTDESGNSSTDTTEVTVPHDNGNRRTITRSRGRSGRR